VYREDGDLIYQRVDLRLVEYIGACTVYKVVNVAKGIPPLTLVTTTTTALPSGNRTTRSITDGTLLRDLREWVQGTGGEIIHRTSWNSDILIFLRARREEGVCENATTLRYGRRAVRVVRTSPTASGHPPPPASTAGRVRNTGGYPGGDQNESRKPM